MIEDSNYELKELIFKLMNNDYGDEAYKLIQLYEQVLSYQDLHFMFNRLQEVFYKKRTDTKYFALAKEVCLRDVHMLINDKLPNLVNMYAYMPCYDRLIIIYEKEEDFETVRNLIKVGIDKNIYGNYLKKVNKYLGD